MMLQLHPSLVAHATSSPRASRKWGTCGAQTAPAPQQHQQNHHHHNHDQIKQPHRLHVSPKSPIYVHPALHAMTTPHDLALAAIDAAHALDPTKITPAGSQQEIPYELHYAQKCTAYLTQHTPSPSPALRLAIRAQHFRRWEVPRSSYPMTRPGYHAWRSFLKSRQASQVEAICIESGIDETTAARVGALIRKEGLKSDEETMVLEDVACLVFLDDQFEVFSREHDEAKILGILRKTWGKMSERGRELALEMQMEGRCKELVEKALAG